MPDTFTKDPDSVKDYQINWESWLNGQDTLSTSNWTVPSGITEDSSTVSTTAATIWLSGGVVGNNYELVNRVVTVGGRTQDQTLIIKCEER